MCKYSIAWYNITDMSKSRTTASRSEYGGYFSEKRKKRRCHYPKGNFDRGKKPKTKKQKTHHQK